MHTVPSRVPYLCRLLIGKPLRISIFACVVAVLLSVFYVAANVPYLALLAATSNSVERKMRTAAVRSLFAMTASFCVHLFTLRLITRLGHGSVAVGWNRMATVYAIIATAVLLLCGVFSCESRVSVLSSRWKKEEVLLLLRSSRWRNLSLAMVFVLAAHSARSAVMLYYMRYVWQQMPRVGLSSGNFGGQLRSQWPASTMRGKIYPERLAF